MRGVLDTTLCDKVCQRLATGRWFSPGTPGSPTNKTDHHDIAYIFLTNRLLNVVLPELAGCKELYVILNKVLKIPKRVIRSRKSKDILYNG
jgi:hypothetical protein